MEQDLEKFSLINHVKINKYWKPLNKIKGSEIYWAIIPDSGNIKAQEKWSSELGTPHINFEKVYRLPYLITNYRTLQSFQYKILHRIINTNKWLFLRKIVESDICEYCNANETDSILHFFVKYKVCKD